MESIYFYLSLQSKRNLWYKALKVVLDGWNNRETYEMFYNQLLRPLEITTPFNILGVTFVPPHMIKNYKPFRKRLTVMPKSSQKDPPFLFDVDLFAIDMYINSVYLIEWEEGPNGTTVWKNQFEYIGMNDQANITGILDMPYAKPTHLGYNLGNPKYNTKILINPFKPPENFEKFFKIETSLNTIKTIEDEVKKTELPKIKPMLIPIANVNYVKHDVELLHRLQLRKGSKLKKDQKRLRLLEKYAGQAVVLDDEERHESEEQTDTQNIKFTDSDVAPLKVSHIVKYLAIPKIGPNWQRQQGYGFISCDNDVPHEVRFDTETRFDYTNSRWVPCCDIVPNQFVFRFDSKELSNWSRNDIQRNNLICILRSWNKYLKELKKYPVAKRLEYIGVMIYAFRPMFLRNNVYTRDAKQTNNLFVDVLMIYAIGLKDIGGNMGKLTNQVYKNLKALKIK